MGALDDITVLDLSRILAGPFCTQMLSDLGATVWKVESPWGDDTRRWGPPFVEGESAYYLSTNRGKKSVSVNLKDERGQELVRGLARKADVLIENFKVGDLARYGLDYASLSKSNPGLVYASVTGFGQTGPRASEPGYDAVLQGMTGLMSVTGAPDGPPMRVGVAVVDLMTGLTTAIGVLSALHERARTGQGEHLDLSLFDVGIMAMVNLAQSYLADGVTPPRLGTAHAQIVPYQAFEASDGYFMLAVGNDAQFVRMAEAVGLPELAQDDRLKTNAGRVAHRDEVVATLSAAFAGWRREDLLRTLERATVPASPIYDLPEVMRDPQADARGVLWDVDHPTLGQLSLIANPLRHASESPASPTSHPPLLGEHTAETLRSALGLSEPEIASLEQDGVINLGRE